MSKVYIFMADGTEEVEALTVVDLLRRAGVTVVTVSIMGKDSIVSSHGIEMKTDAIFGGDYADGDMIVLPGGMPGTNYLAAHEGLRDVLFSYKDREKYLAAICAAPSVLGRNGLLAGKKATCYPGFEEFLQGATIVTDRVAHDGKFITSRGLGTAIDFALELITVLCDAATAEKIAASVQYR